jgi:hypothetical protein
LGEGGSSFATFAQSMPSACYLADKSPYVVHHNPEAYFTNIDAASGTPYACPSTDLPYPTTLPDPLPDFSFVVPDNCHNMHGSSATGKCPGKSDQIIRDGDAWLSQIVPSFLSLGATVIVTFDEASKDSTNGGGHVVTAMVGSYVEAFCAHGPTLRRILPIDRPTHVGTDGLSRLRRLRSGLPQPGAGSGPRPS